MNFDDLTNKEVKEIERWINTYPRKLFAVSYTHLDVYKRQGKRRGTEYGRSDPMAGKISKEAEYGCGISGM